MVSIVGGSELGVNTNSGKLLGGRGELGEAGQGRSGEGVTVNAVTGNLVIQRQDEYVAGKGLDIALLRTYNSQGAFDGDGNGDLWQIGYTRRLATMWPGANGLMNEVGAAVVRVAEDGTVETYEYDPGRNALVYKKSEGAHDTLTLNSWTNPTEYTWTDGATGNVETYDDGGLLKKITDTDGNFLTLAYNAEDLLEYVTDFNGEKTQLIYDTATGKTRNLLEIRTLDGSGNRLLTRVRYTYDGENRLASVVVDLTPADHVASAGAGQTYSTIYSYVAPGSKRISSIQQTDGSRLDITYDVDGRVKTYADWRSSGDIRTTTFTYDTVNRTTKVATSVDPLVRETVLAYNAAGQVTSIRSPQVTPTAGSYVTTSFTYVGDQVATVTDGRGAVTTYEYDAQGNRILERDAVGNTVKRYYDSYNRLRMEKAFTGPDLDQGGAGQPTGERTTHYVYEGTSARLRFVITPEGRVTEYRYNATTKQRITEFVYVGDLKPLGDALLVDSYAGTLAVWATTSSPRTERRDLTYDARGQLATVKSWGAISGFGNGSTGTDTTVQYVYNPAGQLTGTVDGRGLSETFAYDGLGRRTLWVDRTGQYTHYLYDDANNKTAITWDASGLTITTQYDAAGRVVSEVRSDNLGNANSANLATTTYTYDKLGRRITGINAYRGTAPSFVYVYDGLGRRVEEIDALGYATEYVYNAANQVIRTIRYANPLSAGQILVVSNTAFPRRDAFIPTLDAAKDRTDYTLYDAAGRVLKTIDAAGAVVDYVYDGRGLLLQKTQRATVLTTTQRTTLKGIAGEVSPTNSAVVVADAVDDRVTRYFYDLDGRQVGTLDGEGYLTETVYDAGGRVTKQVRYATVTLAANRASGTLAQLKTDATTVANANDQWTYWLYNARGQVSAMVDAERYVTEYRYDDAGNKNGEIRYYNALASYTYNAAQLLSTLRPALSQEDRVAFFLYDGENRLNYSYHYTGAWRADVVSATYADGYSVYYVRDGLGNITAQAEGAGSYFALFTGPQSGRAEHYNEYDSQGRLIAEMSPAGAAMWVAGTIPEGDLKTRYIYDAMGRLISKTEPVDAAGRKARTVYYYDKAGRLTHVVNALGEVTQSSYDAFNGVTTVTRYGTRITNTSTLAGLTGGVPVSGDTFSTLMTILPSAALDSTEKFSFDARGAKISHTDAKNIVDATATYNAFGEQQTSTLNIDATRTRLQSYTYDRRGLLATDTLAGAVTSVQRDAFGRVTQTTDARSSIWLQTYDRLGRVVTTKQPNDTLSRLTTYDAFAQVLTQSDGLGNTTTYSYNTAARTMTVSTPEGVNTTTTQNAFGQVISIKDGRNNTTSYSYDLDGHLLSTTAPIGTGTGTASTTHTYDAAGNLVSTKFTNSVDSSSVKTVFTYDAVGRVLTRTVDPNTTSPSYSGLNLTTRTLYDAKGEVVWTQDASGIWTETQYDRKGQVTAVIVDPLQQPAPNADGTFTPGTVDNSRLNLRTEYTYDNRGKTLIVTEGVGSVSPRVTQYDYDDKGRRTAERIDPNGLKIETNYVYDANDNVVARVDANLKVTRYIYNAKNQLIYSVDPTGAVIKTDYDAEGRVISSTAFADRIAVSGLNLAINVDTLTRATDPKGALVLANPSYATNASNQITRAAYDRDGRLRFSIDGLNYVTEREYDGAGNVIRTTRYDNAMAGTLGLGETPVVIAIAATAPTTGAYVRRSDLDRITQTVYDKANRATFTIDAANFVTQFVYDAKGQVTKQIRYANPMTGTFTDNVEPFIRAAASGTAAQVVTDAVNDRMTRAYYDAAGRVRYSVDAEGYLTGYGYNARGDETSRVVYGVNHGAGSSRQIIDSDTLATLNLLTATKVAADVQHSNTYDRVGRLETEMVFTTERTFDATRYGYDRLGRVVDTTKHWNLANWAVTHRDYDAAGRLTDLWEAYGHPEQTHVRYVLDKMGNRKQIVDTRGTELAERDNVQWAVDMRERLGYPSLVQNLSAAQKAELRALYTTTQEFDAVGRVTKSTDALGGVTQTQYDVFGNAVKVIDPNGNAGYFYFDADNRLQLSADPERYATRMEYNAFGQMVKQTRYAQKLTAGYSETTSLQAMLATSGTIYINPLPAKDVVTRTEFNKRGYAKSVFDGMDVPEIYTYNAFGEKSTFTDRLGATYEYGYDRNGRMASEKSPPVFVSVSNSDGSVWTSSEKLRITNTYGYDARGNLTHLREGVGTTQERLTVTTYNALNRAERTDLPPIILFDPVTKTNSAQPVARNSRATYDSAGNKVEAWDEKNQRSLYYYDRLNRLVAHLDVDGTLHEYEYDSAGNLVHEKTYGQRLAMASQAWTQRPVASTGDTFREMYYGYNANNLQKNASTQAETLFDPRNLIFNDAGKVIGGNGYVTGSVITYTDYDANGNVVQTIDGRGNVMLYFYDKLGRQILVADALGYLTERTFDAGGNLVREAKYEQGLDAVTWAAVKAVYDPNGTVIPSNGTLSVFNALGQLAMTIDTLGRVTVWKHQNNGNATSTLYPQALSGPILIALQNFVADQPFDARALGTAVRGIGQDRTTDSFYNLRGQKITEQLLSVRYTTIGLTGTITQVEDILTSRYEFDANGNLKSVEKANGEKTLFEYDALNRQTLQRDPERTLYTGGSGNTVTTGTIKAETGWSYDYLGRRVREIRYRRLDTSLDDQTLVTRHDAADNIVASWSAANRTDYNLDALGNVLRQTKYSTDVDGVAHTYRTYFGYDAMGRETSRQVITDEDVPLLKKTGETTFIRYNTYGEVTAQGINAGNGDIVQHQYRYDKLGRLFWSNADTGTPTIYLYDANGNAAIEIKAVDSQQANLWLLNTPSQALNLAPDTVQMKFTLYDKRNQATDVYQAPMIFGALTGGLDLSNAYYEPGEAESQTPPGRTDVPKYSTPVVASGSDNYSNINGATITTEIPLLDDTAHNLNSYSSTTPSSAMSARENEGYNGPHAADMRTLTTWYEYPDATLPQTKTTGTNPVVKTVYTGISKVVTHSYSQEGNRVLETIVTKTTTTADVTTTTRVVTDDVINYIEGTVTSGGVTTTTTVNAGEVDVDTKTEKIYHDMSYVTTESLTLQGGDITRNTRLAYHPPVTVSAHVIRAPGSNPENEYILSYSFPAVGGYGTGNTTIKFIEGARVVTADFTGDGSGVLRVKDYKNVRIQIIRGGVVLSEGMPFYPNSLGGTFTVPASVSITGVNDSIKSIFLTSSAGWYGLTRRVEGEWNVKLDAAASGSWQYNLYTQPNYQGGIYGHVEGTSILAPNTRSMQWTKTVTTAYSRWSTKVNGSSGGGNTVTTPSTQSQKQSNYLQNLVYSLSRGATLENVIHRQQSHNAFGDIVSETDGRGNVTRFEYNEMGVLIKKTDPTVAFTDENNVENTAYTPITLYYVDSVGQVSGQKNARGFNTTQVYENGRLVRQFTPMGPSTYYVEYYYYDAFGNLAAVTNAKGLTTRHQYENNKVTRTDFAGGNYDAYQYDVFGNMIKHTNGLGNIEKYKFDGEGRIVSYRDFKGFETTYVYTFLADIGNSGGYRKVTNDVVGGQLTDDVDVFGLIRRHTDLGGRQYIYTYNDAGWLLTQTSTLAGQQLQNIEYTYYKNGYLRSIVDHGIDVDSEALFQYDLDGNRTFESYAQIGATQNDGGLGRHVYQLASSTYDALNRITEIKQLKTFTIKYKYDEVGNRRNVHSDYTDLLDDTAPLMVQDFWYKYDALDRFTLTMGKLDATGHNIIRGDGYSIEYNGINQRTTQKTTDQNGNEITESYEYNDNGFLTDVRIRTNAAAELKVRSRRVNSNVGDVLRYFEYNNDGTATVLGSVARDHKYTYDDNHNLTLDEDTVNERGLEYKLYDDGRIEWIKTRDKDTRAAGITNTFTYEKWDTYKQLTNNVVGVANTPIAYAWKDGLSTLTYDVNGHVKSMYDRYEDRTIDYVNSHNGQVLKRLEYKGPQLVIRKADDLLDVRQFYYFNGRAVGDQGTDHALSRVDYAQTLRETEFEGKQNKTYIKEQRLEAMPAALRNMAGRAGRDARAAYTAKAGMIGDQPHSDIGTRVIPVTSVDFDQNFLPINRDYPARTPGIYVAQTGDTLQQIAAQLWGDSRLWYLIADANTFLNGGQPLADTRLTIPNVVTNIHNNSNTFRPVEPGLTLGNIQPTLPPMPPPPKKDGCGAMGAILVAVVTIVVAIYAPQLIPAIQGFGWGTAAAAAAIGSTAGQLVGMAAGVQDSFSWKQVAIAAVSAGVTHGIGQLDVFSKGLPGVIQQAAVSNIASQGISIAAGQQKKFSWAQVAIAGAGAAVSFQVNEAIGSSQYSDKWGSVKSDLARGLGEKDFGNSLLRGTASSLAGGAVGALLSGQQNWGMVAAQSFATGLGNSMVSMQKYSERTRNQPISPVPVKPDNPGSNGEPVEASGAAQQRATQDRPAPAATSAYSTPAAFEPDTVQVVPAAKAVPAFDAARASMTPAQQQPAAAAPPTMRSAVIEEVVVEARKLEDFQPPWAARHSDFGDTSSRWLGSLSTGGDTVKWMGEMLERTPEQLVLRQKGGVVKLPGTPSSVSDFEISTRVKGAGTNSKVLLKVGIAKELQAAGAVMGKAASLTKAVPLAGAIVGGGVAVANEVAYRQTGETDYHAKAVNGALWTGLDGAAALAIPALAVTPIGWVGAAVIGIGYGGWRLIDAFNDTKDSMWNMEGNSEEGLKQHYRNR